MTRRIMAKKIDESKTYLEEGLSTRETNLKEFCNNLMEKLTSELTSKLETQAERINQLENDKIHLQKQILELKKENIKNLVASEENEQYGRRLCLRIDGISIEKYESSEYTLHKVTEMWLKTDADIPDKVADKTQRVGPSNTATNSTYGR